MTDLGLELTKLIGKKELSFGCYVKFTEYTDEYNEGGLDEMGGPMEENYHRMGDSFMEEEGFSEEAILNFENYKSGEYIQEIEIIGHPANETDFKRWLNEKGISWKQDEDSITVWIIIDGYKTPIEIKYQSSKELLDQDSEILKKIIELIKNNK